MNTQIAQEGIEVSPRFRKSIEQRIHRLECDAAFDETQVVFLSDPDHIRRHMFLVAPQQASSQPCPQPSPPKMPQRPRRPNPASSNSTRCASSMKPPTAPISRSCLRVPSAT